MFYLDLFYTLTINTTGAWDDIEVGICSVLKIGEVFHMWYSGDSESNRYPVGHATSSNGVNWTRDTANPVLDVSEAGQWDDGRAGMSTVIHDGNKFHMWYGGWTGDGTTTDLGHATSEDGSIWTKEVEPVLTKGESGSWDSGALSPGPVLFDSEEGKFMMWYRGGTDIGYAESVIATRTIQKGQKSSWTIYPNPVHSTFSIQFDDPGLYAIEVLTLSGQQILSEKISGSSIQMDLSDFSSGVYIIKMQSKNLNGVEKLTKW